MVKLKGPALAQAAAGGLGKTIIFSQSKGRAYLKRWHKPKNIRSAGQVAMRAVTAFVSTVWKSLPAADKATWSALALTARVSNFNACQTRNLVLWRNFQMPVTILPAAAVLPVQNWASWTYEVLPRGIRHTFTSTVVNDGRGWILHRNPASPATATWENLVHIIPCLPFTSPFTWLDSLEPGSYWYRAYRVSADGAISAASNKNNITVP